MPFGDALVSTLTEAQRMRMAVEEQIYQRAMDQVKMQRQMEQDAIARDNDQWERNYKNRALEQTDQYRKDQIRDKQNDNFQASFNQGMPFGIASANLPQDMRAPLIERVRSELAQAKGMDTVQYPGWDQPAQPPTSPQGPVSVNPDMMPAVSKGMAGMPINLQYPAQVTDAEVNGYVNPLFQAKKAHYEAIDQVRKDAEARRSEAAAALGNYREQKLQIDKQRADNIERHAVLRDKYVNGRLDLMSIQKELTHANIEYRKKATSELGRRAILGNATKLDPLVRMELGWTTGEIKNLTAAKQKVDATVQALQAQLAVPLPPNADPQLKMNYQVAQENLRLLTDPNSEYSSPALGMKIIEATEYRNGLKNIVTPGNPDSLPTLTQIKPNGSTVKSKPPPPGGMTDAEAKLRAKNGIR